MWLLALKLLFCLFIFFNKNANSEEIIGCGGFIKSKVQINFSLIEVKLYTKQGSLKYTTECAPSNGYYMMPVYTKGSYVIKVEGPSGWTFDPPNQEIEIDGVGDKCSKNEDINFFFSGFGFVGSVLSKGQRSGPKGVKLVLKKMEEGKEGAVAWETESREGGEYIFEKVLPGKYMLEASHPHWKFEKSKSPVTIGKATDNVNKEIVVKGYDVHGFVANDESPIQDVNFLLYKQNFRGKVNEIMPENCVQNGKDVKIPEKTGSVFVCRVMSDKNGKFIFKSVQTGNYILLAKYEKEKLKFDIEPSTLKFKVTHDSLLLKEAFHVSGFEMVGKVTKTNEDEEGMEGVKIFLDEKEVAMTTKTGMYQIKGIKNNKNYKITAEKDEYKFKTLNFLSTIKNQNLAKLTVEEFKICGNIIINNKNIMNKKKKINFFKKNSVFSSVFSNSEGYFCIFLPQGSYEVKAEITEEEESSGFKLMPEKIKIDVNDVIRDVTFSQFLAQLAGKIVCLEACGYLKVDLINTMNKEKITKEIKSESEEVEFSIDSVMSGTYQLIIEDNDKWCWEKKNQEINIIDKNLSSLLIEQTGYHVHIHSSNEALVYFKPSEEPFRDQGLLGARKWTNQKIISGHNNFCFNEKGKFVLIIESCHKFSNETIIYDTSSREELNLVSEAHPVHISLTSATRDIVFAYIKDNDKVEKVGPLELKDVAKQPFHYSTTYWAKNNEGLKVYLMAEKLLFEPKEALLHTDPSSCPSASITFSGKKGIFIEGKIEPPLNNVDIEVKLITSQDENDLAQNKILKTKTDIKGNYRLGPVEDGIKYEVKVSKRGFQFHPLPSDPLSFNFLKLAEIIVTIKDDKTDEPLQGVLISLSGESGFRRNNITGSDEEEEEDEEEEDDGVIVEEEGGKDGEKKEKEKKIKKKKVRMIFSGLKPGQYFLKPMMKELVFTPPFQTLSLAEGKTIEISIKAERVSFSCYGTLTTVNGEHDSEVIIEAVAMTTKSKQTKDNKKEEEEEKDGEEEEEEDACMGHQEETKTEKDGNFRIRGLKPGCQYQLKMKSQSDSPIIRTSPQTLQFKMEKEDIRGVVMMGFRSPSHSDIHGRIVAKQQLLSSLKVKIFSDSQLDVPLQTQVLSLSPLFFFTVPINQKYIITVTSSLGSNYIYNNNNNKNNNNNNNNNIMINANQSFHHLTLYFDAKPKPLEQELSQTPILVIPLFIIIIYIIYNYKSVFPWLKSQYETIKISSSSSSSSYSSSSSSSPSTSYSSSSSSLLSSHSYDSPDNYYLNDNFTKKKQKAKKI